MPGKVGKVTSKGQLTIPKEIREYLSVEEGDGVLFAAEGARVYIEKVPVKATTEEVFGILKRGVRVTQGPIEGAQEAGSGPVDVENARRSYRRRLAESDRSEAREGGE